MRNTNRQSLSVAYLRVRSPRNMSYLVGIPIIDFYHDTVQSFMFFEVGGRNV